MARTLFFKPSKSEFDRRAVFNPAVIKIGREIHILYRAVENYEDYTSKLGHAIFDKNLKLIYRSKKPILEFPPDSCEDPRITKLGGRYFMTYARVKNPSAPPYLLKKLGLPKKDPKWRFSTYITEVKIKGKKVSFSKHRKITAEGINDKDVVLFPDKINNDYWVLHRPFKALFKRQAVNIGKINLNKGRIKDSKKLFSVDKNIKWRSKKVGVGCPPIKTKKGWLVIFHGADSLNRYSAGAVLLEKEDPTKIISITKKPILRPERKYELRGDIDKVVFPTGFVREGDNLIIFYGAADKTICIAQTKINKILSLL